MDYEVSDTLRAKLIREGLRAARLQSDRVNGVAGAEGGGGAHRPLPGIAQPGKLKTSMRKATGRMTRNRAAFLMLVVDNDR
ncbi:hypothetical protein O9Z70_06295 [Devosia sp. YIM 151766]|uniref:hypothetical protein n=1 Tax=Devosia sp. YIM 151766 TaxID=3017325 RepID=UPI00255C5386|nr:hypothetical protein [Devosia sp. YIM 151766]WIY54127.1 hypothetical protein O9Z70_06295 [Devosia sp. YIM 151766]